MEIFLAVILFLVGAFLIIKGGDIFVDASGWLSDVTGISRVVIGATIVSLATTSPEYFVSLFAVIKGYNDLSIGNAVGSLICNLGIGFAIIAIFTPGKINDKAFSVKGIIMILSTAMLLIFCLNGLLSIIEGIILFLMFGLFTFINIKFSKNGDIKKELKKTNGKDITLNVFKFILGAAGIIFGANLIVDNGQKFALLLGVPEIIVGLTFVAIGTSLPEIITSITAVIKKESSLSLGNIIGANTLDATLILATGSFISGGNLSVSASAIRVDLPVALLLMLLAIVPTLFKKKFYRWQGFAIAGIYVLYLLNLIVFKII